MCKYCENNKAIFGWKQNYQNVVLKMFTNKEPILHINVNSEIETKKAININYCMFCGKNLKETNEKEYLGIFDVSGIECIILKIKAEDREVADDKFITYLFEKHGYKECDGEMYVIPLFADIETI